MFLRAIALFIILFSSFFGTCPAYKIFVSQAEVRQGSSLIVTLDDVNTSARYFCSFNSADYPLYSCGDNSIRAIIGIPVDLNCGTHTFTIREFIDEDRLSDSRYLIGVVSGNFRKDVIKFSPENKKKMASPKIRDDNVIIGRALKTEGERQFWEGNFITPAEGRISGEFGSSRFDEKGNLLSYHKGIDVGISAGTAVRSAGHGEVVLAGNDFVLCGKAVLVHHGQGISSIYMHLNEISVKEGQVVEKGDTIGLSGSTGLSTGAHLHWGVYVHGRAVDPMFWVNNAP